MKKRIISLLMIACLVISLSAFTACSENPVKVIGSAIEKTGELNSYQAKMEMETVTTVAVAGESQTVTVPMVVDMKVADAKSDSPRVSADYSITSEGITTEMEIYTEGEWVYMVMDGEGYKMSLEDAGDEYNYSESVDKMLKELPEDLLKEVELIKSENGKTATISIPDEMFAEIYSDLVSNAVSSLGEADANVEIKNAVVTVTVDNGYISYYEIAFDMEMSMTIAYVGTVNSTSKVTSKITYENPGENVTVTAPNGYESFENLSN